jgi:hypothetical protein
MDRPCPKCKRSIEGCRYLCRSCWDIFSDSFLFNTWNEVDDREEDEGGGKKFSSKILATWIEYS